MSRIVRSVCPHGKRLGFFLLVSTLFEALPALAQDVVRPSLAGEEAAEARRQDIEHIPYNLVTGPIRYRISATLGFEYNDNIMPVFRPTDNMDAPPERPAAAPWSTAFITRMYRYKSLLLRCWWILLLTICCGLFVEAWLIFQTPPSFQSTSKMMMAGKLNINQGPVYSEDNVNFYGTQIQLMQSAEVRRGAATLIRSTNPELQPVPVELTVAQRPRTSICELQAIGSSPA